MTASLSLASPAGSLTELASAITSSRADLAAEAALRALQAGAAPEEVLGAAARPAASLYDPTTRSALHGLCALSSAARIISHADRPVASLAILQAIHLAASERKLATPAPGPTVVAGEISHLAKSFLISARSGNLAESESLFLGLVEEGKDRRQLGDGLFRAALEDVGDGGHKLIASVRTWQLAQSMRFRGARTILRPAVQYVAVGERDLVPFEAILASLSRAWADMVELGSGVRPIDEPGRAELATVIAAPTPEACIEGMLGLLGDRYAPAALADGIAVEAAKRGLGTEGYSLDAAHAIFYADAARFVLGFTRTSDRLYALFQAALRVRSPAPHLPSVSIESSPDLKEALASLADDVEARRPREAAARVRLYLSAGLEPKALLGVLVHQASLDSSVANGGHNLGLADACASLYQTTRSPEALMVLAKLVAASPRDAAVAHVWSAVLGL